MSRRVLSFVESDPEADGAATIAAAVSAIEDVRRLISMSPEEWNGPDDGSGCGRMTWSNGTVCSVEDKETSVGFCFYVVQDDRAQCRSMTMVEDERRAISGFMGLDAESAAEKMRSFAREWANEIHSSMNLILSSDADPETMRAHAEASALVLSHMDQAVRDLQVCALASGDMPDGTTARLSTRHGTACSPYAATVETDSGTTFTPDERTVGVLAERTRRMLRIHVSRSADLIRFRHVEGRHWTNEAMHPMEVMRKVHEMGFQGNPRMTRKPKA